MKKILFAILSCSIMTQGLAQTIEQQISNIDKMREDILSKIKTYEKIEEYKDSISFRNVYLQDKELKLIIIKTKINNVEKRVSWYFSDEKCIYAEQISISNESNKVLNYEKMYAPNGHLMSWIKTDNTTVSPDSEEFKKADKGLAANTEASIINLQKKSFK